MKTAFFVDGNPNNPGGYNQTLNTVCFISNSFDTENLIFIASNKKLDQKLKNLRINSIIYKKNFFNKLIDYIFGLSFLFKSLVIFNLKHSFTKFLKKNEIDFLIFLSPSELSLFCEDVNFVLNIWDLDHKKDSSYPEHKKNFIFEKREEFLNNVLFKAFKIIVAHDQNKKDLIKFYNCSADKIIVQTFIPYLPNIPINQLEFIDDKERKYINDLPENKKIIIYPASFWPHKNHKYIIDSAILLKKENINDFHFIMCGSDKGTFQYIKQLIVDNHLNENITIFPLVSNIFLKKLYEKCFAVVMPTDSGPTNLPLYESMYFKKPIFYSKNISKDNEIDQIIIPIDIKNPSNFLDKLKNIKNEDIIKKVQLGSQYYKDHCNQDRIYNLYKNIIFSFKQRLSQWKKN